MGIKVDRTQDKVNILALNRLKIFDENGKEVLISSFWKENPVVMIFVRHFSCIACRAHIQQIWKDKDKFEKSNTKIIFIGNGIPRFIKTFKDDMKLEDAPVYTDPSLKTFDASGFYRGVLNLMDPRGVKNFVELSLGGHKQGPTTKDSGAHTQMGGVVAIKPPGIVVYHFISEYLGDNDDLSALKDSEEMKKDE